MNQNPKQQKIRVDVIGTSNSVMVDGWVNLAKATVGSEAFDLNNLSVGGASSCYGAYRLCGDDFHTGADLIVLDFCINDQMFLKASALTVEQIIGNYGEMLATMQRREALGKLLVLMFPKRQLMDIGVVSPLFDRLINMFEGYGVAYIDFRPAIRNWTAEQGLSIDAAYPDNPRHFSREYQQRIAETALAALKCQVLQTQEPSLQVVDVRKKLAALVPVGYRRLEVLRERAVEPKLEGTRHMQQRVHSFGFGDVFSLKGAPRLAAVFIWTHSNSGVLTFGGAVPKCRLHLRRIFDKIFLFDTFREPLLIGDGTKVEVTNDPKIPFKKMLGHFSSNYDVTEATVEVVDFVGCDRSPVDFAVEAEAVLLMHTPAEYLTRWGRIQRFLSRA